MTTSRTIGLAGVFCFLLGVSYQLRQITDPTTAERIASLVPVPLPSGHRQDGTADSLLARWRTLAKDSTLAALPRSTPVGKDTFPHIVVVVAECLRSDALEPSTMPFLDSLAKALWQAKAHHSTANATPHSVFSMLSGQWPTRYGKVARPAFSPGGLGWTFPDRTAWTGNSAGWGYWSLDRELFCGFRIFGDSAGVFRTDDQILSGYFRFRDSTRGGSLGWIHLNTTHYPYEVQDSAVVVRPFHGPRMNLWNPHPEDARLLHARYRNACNLLDRRLRSLVGQLRAQGQWDKTLVLITGDHGEEFLEEGHLTHGMAPNGWESHVPLVVVGGTLRGSTDKPTNHRMLPWILAQAARGLPPIPEDSGAAVSLVFQAPPQPSAPRSATLLAAGHALHLSWPDEHIQINSAIDSTWTLADTRGAARMLAQSGLLDRAGSSRDALAEAP